MTHYHWKRSNPFLSRSKVKIYSMTSLTLGRTNSYNIYGCNPLVQNHQNALLSITHALKTKWRYVFISREAIFFSFYFWFISAHLTWLHHVIRTEKLDGEKTSIKHRLHCRFFQIFLLIYNIGKQRCAFILSELICSPWVLSII